MLRLNSDPQSNKPLRVQTIYYRSEPILAAMRAVWPDPDRAQWQRQIIRDHDQSFDRSFIFCSEAANCLTAQIHIGLRLSELDHLVVKNASPDQRSTFVTPYLGLQLRREQIDEHKSEIVPRLCIFRARITKPDYQPITHVSRLRFLAAAVASILSSCRLLTLNHRFRTFLKLRFEHSFLDGDDRRDHCFR